MGKRAGGIEWKEEVRGASCTLLYLPHSIYPHTHHAPQLLKEGPQCLEQLDFSSAERRCHRRPRRESGREEAELRASMKRGVLLGVLPALFAPSSEAGEKGHDAARTATDLEASLSSSSGGGSSSSSGGGGGGDVGGFGFALVEVREPSTCRYAMTLRTPLPCRILRRDAAEFRRRPQAPAPAPLTTAAAEAGRGRGAGVAVRGKVRRVSQAVAAAVGRLLRALWRGLTARARAVWARARPRGPKLPGGGGAGGVCITSGGSGEMGSLVLEEVKGLREELREVKNLVQQGQGERDDVGKL